MKISEELKSELLGKMNYSWCGTQLTPRELNNPLLQVYCQEIRRGQKSAENRYLSERIAEKLGAVSYNSLKIREYGLAEELHSKLMEGFAWVGATSPEGIAAQEQLKAEAEKRHIEARLRAMFGLDMDNRSAEPKSMFA